MARTRAFDEQRAAATLREIRAAQLLSAGIGDAAPALSYVVETRQRMDAAAVEGALGVRLGITTRVETLFPSSQGDTALDRFLRVHVSGVSQQQMPESPFDLAYRLKDELNLVSCEPDLETEFFRERVGPPGAETADLLDCWVDTAAPDDRSWALKTMRVPDAWAHSESQGRPDRGAGIAIAQPDTGVAPHVELQDALDLSRAGDMLDGDADPTDPLEPSLFGNPGHGTGTASVVASRGNAVMAGVGVSDGQVTGSAPKAELVPIRCIRSVVRISQSRVAQAVEHARIHGCHVVTMSLGGIPNSSLRAAIRRAIDDNILILAAAGNCVGWVVWPAAYDECLAIGATNVADRPWQGSSHGEDVAVSAPGEHVWRARREQATDPLDGIAPGQGTSFAVALTAGVAALWLAHHGRQNLITSLAPGERLQERFRRLLQATARRPPGWDAEEYGAGIVNARALLEAGLGTSELAAAPEDLGRSEVTRIARMLSDAAEAIPPVAATGGMLTIGLTPAELERYGVELSWLALKARLHRRAAPGAGAVIESAGGLPARPSAELQEALSRPGAERARAACDVRRRNP